MIVPYVMGVQHLPREADTEDECLIYKIEKQECILPKYGIPALPSEKKLRKNLQALAKVFASVAPKPKRSPLSTSASSARGLARVLPRSPLIASKKTPQGSPASPRRRFTASGEIMSFFKGSPTNSPPPKPKIEEHTKISKTSQTWLYPTRSSKEELAAVRSIMKEFARYQNALIKAIKLRSKHSIDFANHKELETLAEVFPSAEKPFIRAFLSTQLFIVYAEKIADILQEKDAETRSVISVLDRKLEDEETNLMAAKSLLSINANMPGEENLITDLTDTIRDAQERIRVLRHTRVEIEISKINENTASW